MGIPLIPSGVEQGIGGLLLAIIGIIVAWIIVSLPVYFAAKFVAGRSATLGRAMLATILGPVIYVVVLGASGFLLREFGLLSLSLPIIIAFVAFLGVYKSLFETGWVGAFGIALIAVIILAVVSLLLGTVFFRSLPVGNLI